MRQISEGIIVWHRCFCFPDIWEYDYFCFFSLDCGPHVRPVPRFVGLTAHGHRQRRHLESEEDYYCDSNWRLGDQRHILHSR